MNKEIIYKAGEKMPGTLVRKVVAKTAKPAQAARLPEILFVTSYPPRECGIATYTQDLLTALNNKFSESFSLKVCALESGISGFTYPEEVKHVLDASDPAKYTELAHTLNQDDELDLIVVQHEFGLFHEAGKNAFLQFLYRLTKPVVVVFHTVLPNPNDEMKESVRRIATACDSMIVMTENSAEILHRDYGVSAYKVSTIAHGTHLVPYLNKEELKAKYEATGRKVLSTFGLLGPGKGIETTLNALPEIVAQNPDVLFLVIGKTHPGVVKSEGEKYREMLEAKVEALNLTNNVRFVNRYLPLKDLLEYLQLTDIYLFTSKDPNQAVSGTFSYAMSCGCPIISTPIPHAREVLTADTGIIIDFENPQQLAEGVNRLMSDDALRTTLSLNTLQHIVPTAWENSALAHALLFRKVAGNKQEEEMPQEGAGAASPHPVSRTKKIALEYKWPAIDLTHVKKMTTDFGMLQFSKINHPDPDSGYTLDDNARALIAVCMHYEQTRNESDLTYLDIYVRFIRFCLQQNGAFLNYVDEHEQFTDQNNDTNLEDANGRAIWALGYLLSRRALLPAKLVKMAEAVMQEVIPGIANMHSTRAMAFSLKGLYYYNLEKRSVEMVALVKVLADRLAAMYRHESDEQWHWYESYLTYGNSVLPEAMLCAWLTTGDRRYREMAKTSFDFLLSLTFNKSGIKVISNKSWLQRGQEAAPYGEQPIDVAYTILALSKFYREFQDESYMRKLYLAFNWFLGNNHLHQIIYNPCTGGCFDGLEATHINLNQGAESTLSYLISRLIMQAHQQRGGSMPLPEQWT